MTRAARSAAERRQIAERAVADLGSNRDDKVLVRLRCAASHHVATVYDTSRGPVYATRASHPHGSADRQRVPHQASSDGIEFFDLLEAAPHSDDTLPAWCGCGPRTVSRRELEDAVRSHTRVLQVI